MSNDSLESNSSGSNSVFNPDGCENLTQFKILLDQVAELWGKGQFSLPEITGSILRWLPNLAGLLLELEKHQTHSIICLSRLESRMFRLEGRLSNLEIQWIEREAGDVKHPPEA